MRLYHATLLSNLESITENGLDPTRATGRDKAVWLHTASRREWAILHVQKRHNCTLDEIVIITVQIPRGWIRRKRRGLWASRQTIKPIMIKGAAEFAASPFSL